MDGNTRYRSKGRERRSALGRVPAVYGDVRRRTAAISECSSGDIVISFIYAGAPSLACGVDCLLAPVSCGAYFFTIEKCPTKPDHHRPPAQIDVVLSVF